MAHLSYKQRAQRFAYLPQSCNIAFPFSLLEVVMMGRFASANLNYTEDFRVIKSSGSVKLDNIALQTIRRASRNFPTPKKNYYIKTALVYKSL